jgi:hypothetical protein
MRGPRTQAEDCTSFPDCSRCCEVCLRGLPDPAADQQVMIDNALAQALREVSNATGEAGGERCSEDAYTVRASLLRQGFQILPSAAQ